MTRDDINTVWETNRDIKQEIWCDIESNTVEDIDWFEILVRDEIISTQWIKV